jgi:hypothetical protein
MQGRIKEGDAVEVAIQSLHHRNVDASSDTRRELAGFASSFITAIDLG